MRIRLLPGFLILTSTWFVAACATGSDDTSGGYSGAGGGGAVGGAGGFGGGFGGGVHAAFLGESRSAFKRRRRMPVAPAAARSLCIAAI